MTQEQNELIQDALLIGMALDDAYIFAGLSPADIAAVSEDEELQASFAKTAKTFEYDLLTRLNKVVEKQSLVGNDHAITWTLEHMYPNRYANKTQGDGKTVNIVLNGNKDPATDTEVVEMHA